MSDMASHIDHRNFILNMFPNHGQDLASHVGYATPDDQVKDMESVDVLKNWAVLGGSGVLQLIRESAQWMALLGKNPESTQEGMFAEFVSLTSFAVALVIRLREEGLIALAIEPIIEMTEINPETMEVTDLDPLNYSYKEVIGHLDFTPDDGAIVPKPKKKPKKKKDKS